MDKAVSWYKLPDEPQEEMETEGRKTEKLSVVRVAW